MEDWTRVVLYGTHDGFVRSTDESLQIAIMLDSGERVEIPSECVMSADQIVKKDKIKLKDVIKRIKDFDLVTQAVWINGILNELGSGYGLHKYHEGYKQGMLEGAMEREKVTITQDIADYIEYAKENDWDLQDAMDPDFVASEEKRKISDWFYKDKNMETFALAWINGYIVKEEKRYLVKVKGHIHDNVLVYGYGVKRCFFSSSLEGNRRAKHTRKELEENGFGKVFNNPLFEVEEVE